MNRTGVYKIENIENGRFYIGSTTKGFQSRWTDHKYQLNKGTHGNSLLQEDWIKYGEDAFQFTILEILPKDFALEREAELINQYYDGGQTCYNVGRILTVPPIGHSSSIGTPNPVVMRELLDYLAQKKRERLAREAKAQASKPAEHPATRQQPVTRA